jgi:hypothetical protein
MGLVGWIIVAIVVVAVILVVAWFATRRRRLRSQFGSEYDRVAGQSGSTWRADSELAARQDRRQKLNIRPLDPLARDRYASQWQVVQAQFVDQPYEAVAAADAVVQGVMRDRGYPMDNFEQNAADLSVDYPNLVENYRGAHAVATQQRSANTEELRTAMLHYRALFVEVLGEPREGQSAAPAVATDRGQVEPDGQDASRDVPEQQPASRAVER